MDDGEATSRDLLTLAELTAPEPLDDLEIGPALDWIAELVDVAGDDANEPDLKKALAWADEIEADLPSLVQRDSGRKHPAHSYFPLQPPNSSGGCKRQA